MRFALVSDIHGNLTALEAVIGDIERRGVEFVVQGGDLAVMGPRPVEVLDRVRELGWPSVVGNIDEVLWRPELHEVQLERAPALAPLLSLVFDEYVPWALERLDDDRVDWLRSLPAEHRVGDLALVHASPGDLWRAPMPDADDEELASTYGPLAAPLAAYCHIHQPFVRVLDNLVVANSGSVGLPFDGDPRASYLLVDDGKPSVVRVEYDVEQEVKALQDAGHPDAERLAQIRRTGRFVQPGAA
jgi:predicted phosphodiesterase